MLEHKASAVVGAVVVVGPCNTVVDMLAHMLVVCIVEHMAS